MRYSLLSLKYLVAPMAIPALLLLSLLPCQASQPSGRQRLIRYIKK